VARRNRRPRRAPCPSGSWPFRERGRSGNVALPGTGQARPPPTALPTAKVMAPVGEPRRQRAGAEQPDRRQRHRDPERGRAEQVRQQREERSEGEGEERCDGRRPRRGQVVGVDPELLTDMHPQALFRISGQLRGHLPGELGRDAAVDVHGRELGLLGFGVAVQLGALDVNLGPGQLGLRGDGGVLPHRHGERAGDQAGHPGQGNGAGRGAAAGDTGDQGQVGDESVHGAEDGWAQRAAGDVAVLVVCLGYDPAGRTGLRWGAHGSRVRRPARPVVPAGGRAAGDRTQPQAARRG